MEKVNQILVAIDRSAMAEEALKRAISIAKEKGFTRFPVYENDLDNIKGILIIYELLKQPLQNSANPVYQFPFNVYRF